MSIDLNSLSAVESFVKQFKKRNWPLHVLILNAGTGSFYQRRERWPVFSHNPSSVGILPIGSKAELTDVRSYSLIFFLFLPMVHDRCLFLLFLSLSCCPESLVDTHAQDGFEKTFAVNYLGHFLLTCGLINELKKVTLEQQRQRNTGTDTERDSTT